MASDMPKTRAELARYIDAAMLHPDTTPKGVARLCKEAAKNGYFGVDVLPCYVAQAKKALRRTGVAVMTVIGYPLGANVPGIKAAEAARAVSDGADELDMVMAIGQFKAKNYKYVASEIEQVVRIAKPKPVKVIIECGYLSDREIAKASKLAAAAGAAFVKTGTGWSPRNASVKDVRLIRGAIGPEIGIKAAGGIRTAEQALALIHAGATRIGTSAAAQVLEGMRE